MNFFEGPDASLDDDNMAKPIRDAMNGLVYDDDKQISHSEHSQTSIDGFFQIRGASKIVVDAIWEGKGFVYVRIEEPAPHTRLPE